MKKRLLLFTLFLSFGFGFAQTKDSLSVEEQERRKRNIEAGNPFKEFGYTPKIATLSQGKYLEWHDLDSIVKIGSYSYHVKKKEITGYKPIDPSNLEDGLSPVIISRWLSPDPLAEEFPSWSPYNYVMNNPVRMTDPTGLAPLDIITINNDGSINRLATNDDFDIVQNQDGSKSFQVDHKDGKSQIGQVQTAVSEQNSVDFLVIQDKGIAEQFFEFAADFSTTEYSLDSFSFADGFSTNAITLGESPTGGALGGQVTPIGQFSNIDLGGGRLTSDALWTENSHFHTNGGWIPSGFKGWLKEGNHHFEINNRVGGDRQFMEGNGNRIPNNAFLYDKNTKGYTKYDSKSAEYIGRIKN